MNVLEDMTEAKERELRERFLSHASEALASSLDYEETLTRMAELAVPDLADWCSVEMLEETTIHQLAVAHVDPARPVSEPGPPRTACPQPGIIVVTTLFTKEFARRDVGGLCPTADIPR